MPKKKKTPKSQKFVTKKELAKLSFDIGQNMGQLKKQIDDHLHTNEYAEGIHDHDEYLEKSHTHDNYSKMNHAHPSLKKDILIGEGITAIFFLVGLTFIFLGLKEIFYGVGWAFEIVGIILFLMALSAR